MDRVTKPASRDKNGTHAQKWTAAANAITATETGLSPNTTYTRHLHAFNSVGESKPSNDAKVYTSVEPVSGLVFGAVTVDRVEFKSANTPSNLAAGESGLELGNEVAQTSSGWLRTNDFWASFPLIANKGYTFTAQSRNGDGEVTPMTGATKWTLPVAPAVTCNLHTDCPTHPVGSTFIFTSVPTFGPGGVDHYHYYWDNMPAFDPSSTQLPQWRGGTISETANNAGRWYLHLMSHNGEEASGGTADIGPFVVTTTATPLFSAGDYDKDCDVDADDLARFVHCAAGPDLPVAPDCAGTSLDKDDDLDQTDFGIFQRCWTGGAPSDPLCGH